MLEELTDFIGDCVEAVTIEVLADQDTACFLGAFVLSLITPLYLLWAAWPRKKPLEYQSHDG